MVLLQDGDATENVNPLLFERTGGVVVAAFTHLRKFLPFVAVDVVQFSSVRRPVLIFASSSNDHKSIGKRADGMSMSRVLHVGLLLQFSHWSRRIIELPALIQRLVVCFKLSSTNHKHQWLGS